MRWLAGAALTAVAVLFAPGCSREDEPNLPAGCRAGPDAVKAALERAPEPVTVEGTRLSACFVNETEAGDLQQLGATYVSVAGDLAARARGAPQGAEAVQLGYLIGAARQGSGEFPGIHTDLLRRLEQEGAPFERSAAYRRGLRAGRAGG